MKSLAYVLTAAALIAGCQNESKLDSAGGGGGDLAARVKKLEETNAKYAEAFDYLQKAYDNYKKQMQQQQQAQEESEPPDDAVFAVDISSDIANHQVEGPNSATVTVVEAWDFA
jgi:outer membrane murein-binding lipoprotein Lpp